jgi:hypothetical protein
MFNNRYIHNFCLYIFIKDVGHADSNLWNAYINAIFRECDRQPWGFPGQPAPVPAKTHTRIHGCGFLRVRVVGFLNPVGSHSHTGVS